MALNRRDLLTGLGGLAATVAFNERTTAAGGTSVVPQPSSKFPRKADFNLTEGATYLDNASTHPMPVAAMQAYRASIERRGQAGAPARPGATSIAGAQRPSPTAAFAALINANPQEVGYVQNTSHGENLVIESLGLDRNFTGNVVTDWLHFEGHSFTSWS